MGKLTRPFLRVTSADLPGIDSAAVDVLNKRFRDIETYIAHLTGHDGPIQLLNDINLSGKRVKNLGNPVSQSDAVSFAGASTIASAATLQGINQLGLDITALDQSIGVFDGEAPTGVQSLTLTWKKKVGWIARWKPPTNIVKVFGYFVSFFNDAGNTQWMDPETGQAVASQSAAEKFVETTHFSTNLNAGDLAAPFSTTGVKVRIVAQVKIKGKGQVRGATVDFPSLVTPGQDPGVQQDVGPAGAVVGLTLVWGAKKKGYKGTWQPPTVNNLSIQGYWCFFTNGLAGAAKHYMNAETGAIANPDTEAGAKVFVTDTRITTGLEASQLASTFQTGVDLTVWAVNRVNSVNTDGARTTTAVVPIAGEDTGPPSAVRNLALVWGAKKKGWKGTWRPPNTNNLSIQGYYCYFTDDEGVNFMDPETGLIASPNTAAGARVFVGDTRIITGLEASQVDPTFQDGVTLSVSAVNLVGGVQTEGVITTTALIGIAGEDTGPPSAVQNLLLVWGRRKKGFKATWKRPATNHISTLGYNIAFMNDLATHFMDAGTGQIANPDTEVGATVFVPGSPLVTGLTFAELDPAFQAGAKIKVTAMNLVAGVETLGTPTTSTTVIPNQDTIPSDSDVPSAPPAPLLEEYIGGVRVRGTVPGLNSSTLLDWQFAMNDNGFAPTTTDPPTSGAAVFAYKQDSAGQTHFRIPALPTTVARWFFCRVKNASSPSTGGPGNNGWSAWSTAAIINNIGTSSVIQAAVGTGPPILGIGANDPNAALGYATIVDVNNSNPIPADKEPARIWFNADTGLITLEIIFPTNDPNAFSLTAIMVEQYKASSGALRGSFPVNPALQTTIQIPALGGFSAIRYRFQNNWRNPNGATVPDSNIGFSPWTNYMQGAGTSPAYNPAINPPPTIDYRSFAFRPNPYSGIL